jgi:hypothetical protein
MPHASLARRVFGLACTAALVSGPATAHGFGERYDLPLPLSHYLMGGAAVVAMSFVVFGLFVRRGRSSATYPTAEILAGRAGRIIRHPSVLFTVKLIALALFLVTILAGLIGDQNPYRNIAPTLVWIIWWVGFAYVSAFVGNLWALINPWSTVFDGADWLWQRLGGGNLAFNRAYPEALGAWPACALLLAFSWTELVYSEPAVPMHIAVLAIAYSLLTWTGMIQFGRDVWLANGEMFTLFFGLLSRLAPSETRAGRLLVRPIGAGLLEDSAVTTAQMAFILLMLASVLYDGLIATPEWASLESWLQTVFPQLGSAGELVIKTLGLIGFWLLFLAGFIGVSALMSSMARRRRALEIARSFALTLIPIAIGYHVAHYLVYLLIQGQYIIPLASDPFGLGWNLFGTAGYRVDIALAGARFAWYAALVAIVAGHVAAVYLAHVRAFAVFDDPSAVIRSQIPLTALMVAYTFTGLSIAAEPIVERSLGAKPSAVTTEIAIPADAVMPDDGSGHIQSIGRDKFARLKLTYKMLGSPFQDGSKMTAADLLYAFAFVRRWSTRSHDEPRRYDQVIDRATAPMRQHLLALRVTGLDTASKSFRIGDVSFLREIFTVEVYLDTAPDDLDRNAAIAPPFTTLPWHLLVLMEEAVARGWAAFSEEEAQQRGVEWLDLVRSKGLSTKLDTLVARFAHDAYRPDNLRGYVSEDEARKRWTALAAFYKSHNHFLVTNGPYMLKSWTNESVALDAFRDLSYPLGVGSYDAYAVPRHGFITGSQWSGETLTFSGDIEIINKFQRSYKIVRAPLASLPTVVLKRAAPECRYVVSDQNGRIVLSGVAAIGADSKFVVDFRGQLPPGRYTASAFIAVNGNAVNPDIKRLEIVVPARP